MSTFCYYLSLFIKGLSPSRGHLSQYFDQGLLYYLFFLNFNSPQALHPCAGALQPRAWPNTSRNLPGQLGNVNVL